MQKITCHGGKCKEDTPIDRVIGVECNDDICYEIEKSIYGNICTQ